MFPFPDKKNKFLSSSSASTSKPRSGPGPEETTTTTKAPNPPKPNSFLTTRGQTWAEPVQAQVPQATQAPQQAQPQAEVEFPVLSKGSNNPASISMTTTTKAYKSALLSKIDVTHAEEQARIQRAVRREMERNVERRRQLELAARRERFVKAAMNSANGMAYDDDDANNIDLDLNKVDDKWINDSIRPTAKYSF